MKYEKIADRLKTHGKIRFNITSDLIELIENRYPLKGRAKVAEYFRRNHGTLRVFQPDEIIPGTEVVLIAESLALESGLRRRLSMSPATHLDSDLPTRELDIVVRRAIRWLNGCDDEINQVLSGLEPIL